MADDRVNLNELDLAVKRLAAEAEAYRRIAEHGTYVQQAVAALPQILKDMEERRRELGQLDQAIATRTAKLTEINVEINTASQRRDTVKGEVAALDAKKADVETWLTSFRAKFREAGVPA